MKKIALILITLLLLSGCTTKNKSYCTITLNDTGLHKVCFNKNTPVSFYSSIPSSSGELIDEFEINTTVSSYKLLYKIK